MAYSTVSTPQIHYEETVVSNVLPCGHPCVLCAPGNASKALESDHSYFQTPTRHNGTSITNTPCTPANTFLPAVNSTPRKLNIPETPRTYITESITEEELNGTFSVSFRDDSDDETYICETDSTTSGIELEETAKCPADEKKFIVFESCLDQLLVGLKCSVPNCTSAIDPDDIKKDMSDGTVIRCSVHCTSGHLVMRWTSQPVIGKMPAGNLLTSAAILFSGLTHRRLEQFSNFLNLKFISHTTFNNIQREQLMPVVLDSWKNLQNSVLQEVRTSGRPLRLAGDGRCDSPGFSAKYCTYSLMDLETDAIVSFVVVNVTETGSSSKMEVEGFRRCMTYLMDLGFQIQVLTTDRHVQIRSVMKKEFTTTKHQFDVWHLAKSIKKKLALKAKTKGTDVLNSWIRSVCNHLWWCAANCNVDEEWLEESWTSLIHHVANVHTFEGEKVTECPHEPLQPDAAKKKKWLKWGSKAHNALKEVVLDKRIKKDVRQLSEFCHTGGLESYHSMMTKYVPKRQEFDQDQMESRTALAAIDHNMSRNRGQRVSLSGEDMFRPVCPKATVQWVAKPVYIEKSYDWVRELTRKVIQQKEKKLLPPIAVKKRGNIAPHPAPPKHELVLKMRSRFNKKCVE